MNIHDQNHSSIGDSDLCAMKDWQVGLFALAVKIVLAKLNKMTKSKVAE